MATKVEITKWTKIITRAKALKAKSPWTKLERETYVNIATNELKKEGKI